MGQPLVALERLESHERLFQNPHLRPEAIFIRIEALLLLKRNAEANALGELLLSAQPDGALAQRVRSILHLTTNNVPLRARTDEP